MKTKSNKIWLLLSSIPLLIVAVSIFWLRPFFGLMDDANLLREVATPHTAGFIQGLIGFVQADYGWGMFRPLYFFMIHGLYGVAKDSPQTLFLLNFVLASLSIVLLGLAGTCLISERSKRIENFALYLLLVLSVPWTHDLFLHPSLQEKLVFFGATLAISFFGFRAKKASAFEFYLLGTVTILLGVSTKAQFLMLFPGLLALAWHRTQPLRFRAPKLEWIYFLLLTLFCTFALKTIAAQGSYTKTSNLHQILLNLVNPKSLVLIATSFLLLMEPLKKWIRQGQAISSIDVFLPLTLLSYVAIFSQWSIGSYLLSGIAPFLSLSLVVLLERYIKKISPPLCSAVLAVAFCMSILVSAQRSYTFIGRLADLGNLLESSQFQELNTSKRKISMACQEGASALQYYAKRFKNLDLNIQFSAEASKDSLYLGDQKLCPHSAPIKNSLLASKRSGDFKLYE